MEAFFTWEDNQFRKVPEEQYRIWLDGFRIDELVKPFGCRAIYMAYNIFAQYEGYIDYYEEGMEVAPFVLHFIADNRNDPGDRSEDLTEYFTNLEELIKRRNKLISQVSF